MMLRTHTDGSKSLVIQRQVRRAALSARFAAHTMKACRGALVAARTKLFLRRRTSSLKRQKVITTALRFFLHRFPGCNS